MLRLIALFVLLSPIAVDAVDYHELARIVNEYGDKMMPKLEKLSQNGEHAKEEGPTKILGEHAGELIEIFRVLKEESQDAEHRLLNFNIFSGFKNIRYSAETACLYQLRNDCFGETNPFFQHLKRVDFTNLDHAKLASHLKEKLDKLKKKLGASKKSNLKTQQLAVDCVEIRSAMGEKVPTIAGQKEVSVPENIIHWGLSTLAVNLWAFAALGVPGAEEAAKISEQVHPIVFPAPKGSGMEEVESSNVKKVAAKMHGTGGAGHSTP